MADEKKGKPGRKKRGTKSSFKEQAIKPIVLSPKLKDLRKKKGLSLQETLFINAQVEEKLSPEDAARAAGYYSNADSFKKIAKRVGAKPHVAQAMKEVLDSKGLGVDKIASEIEWGLEESKQARVVEDPKTGEVVKVTPNLGVHAKYLAQLQNLNGLSTKGPTVAIQNNLGNQGS